MCLLLLGSSSSLSAGLVPAQAGFSPRLVEWVLPRPCGTVCGTVLPAPDLGGGCLLTSASARSIPLSLPPFAKAQPSCLLPVPLPWLPPSALPLRSSPRRRGAAHTRPLPLIRVCLLVKLHGPRAPEGFAAECSEGNTRGGFFSVQLISICRAPVLSTSSDKSQVIFSPVSCSMPFQHSQCQGCHPVIWQY